MAKGRGQTIRCVCGQPMRRDNVQRHLLSSRHRDLMKYLYGEEIPQEQKDLLKNLTEEIEYYKEKYSKKTKTISKEVTITRRNPTHTHHSKSERHPPSALEETK